MTSNIKLIAFHHIKLKDRGLTVEDAEGNEETQFTELDKMKQIAFIKQMPVPIAVKAKLR